MEGREKPHTDKYKVIANDWNYDARCMCTSLPLWEALGFYCTECTLLGMGKTVDSHVEDDSVIYIATLK
jgi:hypothetical protein